MITTEIIEDGILMMHIAGKIEKSDIESGIKQIEAAQEKFGKISILVDLEQYDGFSAEAFIADLRYGLGHLSSLSKYERIAVLTDADWIEGIIWLENKILRHIDIQCFEPEERALAEQFVKGQEIKRPPHKPSVTRITTNRDDALAFEVSDKLRSADSAAVMTVLKDAFDKHGKIDLLIMLDDYDGFEASAIFNAETWKVKGASLTKLRRYAIVGGPSYMRSAASFFGSFIPAEIKTFDKDEEASAWDWIDAEPMPDNPE